MEIRIPEFSLVLLIGPSGCGKSTFAQRHFSTTEIVSSDKLRGLISDDENDQSASHDAFRLLHEIVGQRLARKRLTVVDATNVEAFARKSLLGLAHRTYTQVIAIVFDLPAEVCFARARERGDRSVPEGALRQQHADLQTSLSELRHERYHSLYILKSVEEVDGASVVREALPVDKRHLRGPFDIIGDVHGCYDELFELLTKLGYHVYSELSAGYEVHVAPPEGRTLVLVGDLVDRGPKVPAVLKLAMSMVAAGTALCVPGNHDDKLMRALKGRHVKIAHGLEKSLEQLSHETSEFRKQVCEFIETLPSHLVLDSGKLVIAHAGLKESMHGRVSDRIRDFALYGDTTGKLDQYGLPERLNWAKDYHGQARVVYGHTPVPRHEWQNRTINIDTGCVFGGGLSALRYPELELVSVLAHAEYSVSARPFLLEKDALRPEQERAAERQKTDSQSPDAPP